MHGLGFRVRSLGFSLKRVVSHLVMPFVPYHTYANAYGSACIFIVGVSIVIYQAYQRCMHAHDKYTLNHQSLNPQPNTPQSLNPQSLNPQSLNPQSLNPKPRTMAEGSHRIMTCESDRSTASTDSGQSTAASSEEVVVVCHPDLWSACARVREPALAVKIRVEGLGTGVEGLGFRGWGLGFRGMAWVGM